MPKPKQHQEKADHHRAFLATITADRFQDWAAVVAFYCAVELVEKLRAYDGQHSESHHDRLDYLQRPPHRVPHHGGIRFVQLVASSQNPPGH